MKLFVWEYSERYEGCLAFAIAKNVEEAKELIKAAGDYRFGLPELFDEDPDEREINESVAFCMSHSG